MPCDHLLVLNAGSSSLKFAVYELAAADEKLLCRGQIAGIGREPRCSAADAGGAPLPFAATPAGDHAAALQHLLHWLAGQGHAAGLAGIGHRVVHGGTRLVAPCRITAAIIDQLAALEPLAPHHQPHNLAAILGLAAARPDLPQIACFDTAFHATQPAAGRRYALPQRYAEAGILRYGFHGLSYEYVADRLRELGEGSIPQRTVVAHLGNGASLCAIRDGRSIATTMGFSTLDGLIMATRCGSLDPGIILHLMRSEGAGLAELEDLLYNRSGLLGLSGISADMKALLASDDPRASEAVAQYCAQIGRHLGSLAAALGGLDALVFTGGVGENAAAVRGAICRDAAWLGLAFDEAANAAGAARISRPGSAVAAWILPTDEERVIARHARRLLEL